MKIIKKKKPNFVRDKINFVRGSRTRLQLVPPSITLLYPLMYFEYFKLTQRNSSIFDYESSTLGLMWISEFHPY